MIAERIKVLREQQPDQDINRLLQEIEQSLSSVSERLPWQALFRKPYLKSEFSFPLIFEEKE